MSLLSDAERQQVRDLLSEMTGPVRLRFYTQAIGCETCADTRQILDLLAGLSDQLTVDERNLVLERADAETLGVDRAPTILVLGVNDDGSERDEGVRFAGAPFGYEFTSLLDAIVLVSRRSTGLSEESARLLEAVTTPMTIQVFTTPT